jgi:hypothetical protein
MTWVALLVLAGSVYVTAAHAQCATGVDTGGGQCVPPEALQDNGSQQHQVQPKAVWADRWGAIAIDSKTGGAGTVAGRASKAEAIAAAMGDCGSHGSQTCEVETAYSNQCAAIAWGSTAHDTARGPDKSNTEASAMEGCGKLTSACKIVYSDCSLPVRIK